MEEAWTPVPLDEVKAHARYVQEMAETGAEGHFSAAVDRLLSVASLGNPDTIAAWVVVTASGQQYQPLPSGRFRTDSVRVTLLFVPWREKRDPPSITVRLSLP